MEVKDAQDLILADLSKVIELDPSDPDHFTSRSSFLLANDHYQPAIADFTQAIELSSDSITLLTSHSFRGFAYVRDGDYDRGFEDLNRAIEIDPSHAESYRNRGRGHFEVGKYELAIADYTKAIKLDPEDALALKHRSDAYRKMGQKSAAENDLAKMQELEK